MSVLRSPRSLLPPPGLSGRKECVQPPPGFSPGLVETEMPRRIAGPIWAIRITMTLSEEEEKLFNIPNMVCVYHAGGMRANRKSLAEKPHYHLYYNAGKEVTQKEVQELVKSNEIVTKYYKASNGFWSVETDPGYDLNSYWNYVWKDYPKKKQRLMFWNIPEPQLPIPDFIMESPGNVIALGPLEEYRHRIVEVKKDPKKSALEKQQKFLKFVKEYYEGTDYNELTPKKVIKRLYDYCGENGFTTEHCCFTWVNYVLANLLTDDQRKKSRSAFAARLESRFFY